MLGNARHSNRRQLLAVFAHPDDESFIAGGTLAKYAHLGWDVFLVCATYGEEGQRGEYESLGVNEFANIRRVELQDACKALGIHPPIFLECEDRAVAGICWNSAAKQVTSILRRLQPDVVITFGLDGISGHPDHVSLSQIVTSAFWAALVHRFPWRPARNHSAFLYYALRSPAVPQLCRSNESISAPALTTVIDIVGFGESKLRAIRCHRSQRHLQPPDSASQLAIINAPEYFHRAYPQLDAKAIDSSLFEPQIVEDRPRGEVEHASLRE